MGFFKLFPSRPSTPTPRPSFPTPSAGASTGQAPLPRDSDQYTPRDRSRRTINVIVFGETGVGKSAVVNLIAQQRIAAVSSGVDSCTMTSTPYDVAFDGLQFRIFDTAGFNEPDFPARSQDAIVKAYQLIQELTAAGGIHLLLFCMRRGKITLTTRNNYKLFAEFFCQQRVPVGVVVTNCEHEPDMEGWWTRNSADIEGHGIRSSGHACVTTVTDGRPAENAKYRASQRNVRELLRRCHLRTDGFRLDETDWLARVGQGLNILAKLRRKDAERALKRLGLRTENIRRVLDMMDRRA